MEKIFSLLPTISHAHLGTLIFEWIDLVLAIFVDGHLVYIPAKFYSVLTIGFRDAVKSFLQNCIMPPGSHVLFSYFHRSPSEDFS